MATINLDPAALRDRYAALMAEADRIKKVLDVLPDIEALSVPSTTTTGGSATSSPDRFAPVNQALLDQLSSFVEGAGLNTFSMPEVLDWLAEANPAFDREKSRDAVTAGLRHLVAKGLIHIKVPGVGRRAQVWAKGMEEKAA